MQQSKSSANHFSNYDIVFESNLTLLYNSLSNQIRFLSSSPLMTAMFQSTQLVIHILAFEKHIKVVVVATTV